MQRASLSTTVAVCLLPLIAAIAAAQSPTTAPATQPAVSETSPKRGPLPTVEELEQRLAAISEGEGLSKDAAEKIRNCYTQAIGFIRELQAETRRLAEFKSFIDSAPQRLETIRNELAKPMTEPDVKPAPEAKLADLELSLRAAQAEVEKAKSDAAGLDAQAQQRSVRRVEAPRQVAAVQKRLDELRTAADVSSADDPAALTTARRMQRRAEEAALSTNLESLTTELSSYEARGELLTARRDLAARRLAVAEKHAAAWQNIVRQRQEQELARQREETMHAKRQAARSHPALAIIGEQNEAIVAERGDLAAKRKVLEFSKKQINDRRAQLDRKLAEIKTRAETARRSSETLALILRKIREELPNVRALEREIEQGRAELERAQLRLIELEQQRGELVDPAAAVDAKMRQISPPVQPEQAGEVRDALAQLYTAKRDYLTALYTDYDNYFNTLVEASGDEQALVEAVNSFAAYIDERVLWIRSANPIGPGDILPAIKSAGWLARPESWSCLLADLRADAWRNMGVVVLSVLLALAAIVAFGWSRSMLGRIAKSVDSMDDRFSLTLLALAPTVLLALPIPLIMWLLSWRLWSSGDGSGLAAPLAAGLDAAAALVFTMELIRQVARPMGLGEVHFRWKPDRLRPLRLHLPWLTFALAPLTFLAYALEQSPEPEFAASLGRAAYMASKLVMAVGIALIFRPDRGVLSAQLRSEPHSWLNRLRLLWFPMLVAVPIVFATLAGSGYYYSAMQLDDRLFASAWLLLGVMLVHAMFRRGLFVARRALVLKQRRRRQAERDSAAEADRPAGGDLPEERLARSIESRELDVYTINVQTRKLLATVLTVVVLIGLWAIWAKVLPALGYLDRVVLWSDGADDIISLADLARAIVIAVLTIVASGNIPGLLEIVALQRLPLEAGVRFAITTLVRYVVIIVGLIMTFGAVGIGWSKVQWIAAAITLGLGFGLQEIFANFVSGLIILFEQPIRVGDVVTVGDVSGVVSRIRMRATTITDWDRKEYIVPNKEFVTGRMLNWTLSDTINRVTIKVGVAYGTDTEKARQLLAQIARGHPAIMADPAPLITFEGFGDSSLDLVLRAYLPSLENRLGVVTDLHTAIDKAFRSAGIEIAFPQRDLHIRTVAPKSTSQVLRDLTAFDNEDEKS